MQNDNSYKKCPFCNKIIMANAVQCKHCGNILPHEEHSMRKNNFNNSNSDTGLMFIGKIATIIFIVLILYSFLGDVAYQLKHLSPKVSQIISQHINPKAECSQQNIIPPQQISIGQGKTYRILLKQAKYSLSGIIVTKNTNFWLRGVMQNEFDKVVPLDLGIVWGDIADEKLLKEHFKFKSFKTLGEARMLRYKWTNLSFDSSYINSHISHNHIIPANDNIASALLKLRKWDVVKLDGYLVDMIYLNGTTSYTSLSRSDTNPTSRGSGACEIFYVEGVQIGDKYYR